ncbi:MAG: glycosyltransferase [Ruminococcus sp.]|nr:glycosyltransferase [Ruminococcus sp.]
MRVLIINELYKSGGAEMQTMRERSLLKQFGNEAMVITLDPNFDNGWLDDCHYNISKRVNPIKKQLGMVFSDNDIVSKMKAVIKRFKPDYIHINNAKEHAISVFKAVDGYKCLRTIRDYGAVCPNSQSICSDLSLCKAYQNGLKCCAKCLKGKSGKLKRIWKWICFKRRNAVQKKVIKQFACPSQMLTDYCNRFGLKTTCINNPFDFSMLADSGLKKPDSYDKKIYLFYGQVIDFKGIEQLMEAFCDFAKNKNDVELHVAGMLPDIYKDTFDELLKKYGNGKISYLGNLSYDKIIAELFSVHTVVIPSLWIENYPNTALEATAVGCLVLGSERGGMREIIGTDRFIFSVLDKDSIIDKLELAYSISDEEYKKITKENKERVKENNSFATYYNRLLDCLKSIA